MTLNISEIFYSIQGESTFSGMPCVFIRLAGCNLRCRYCDTQYAYNDTNRILTLSRIVEKISHFTCPIVEITGGEPLYQKKTPELIHILLEKGYTVLLETNGSLDIGNVDKRCIKIMDIKCPSSGESDKNRLENIGYLEPYDQVKFVIADQRDYIYAKSIIPQISPKLPKQHILLSPAFDTMPYHILAEWILADKLDVRFHIQLHKLIWPDISRGV